MFSFSLLALAFLAVLVGLANEQKIAIWERRVARKIFRRGNDADENS